MDKNTQQEKGAKKDLKKSIKSDKITQKWMNKIDKKDKKGKIVKAPK